MANKNRKDESDNSVATDNVAYIGTDPVYQSHTDVKEEPMLAAGEDADPEIVALEKRAKQFEEDRAKGVGFHGYTPDSENEDKGEAEGSTEPEKSEGEKSEGEKTEGGGNSPI